MPAFYDQRTQDQGRPLGSSPEVVHAATDFGRLCFAEIRDFAPMRSRPGLKNTISPNVEQRETPASNDELLPVPQD
jgi:hypothetical protein